MQDKLFLTFVIYVGFTQCLVNGLLLRPPYYFGETPQQQQKGIENQMKQVGFNGIADNKKAARKEMNKKETWFHKQARQRKEIKKLLENQLKGILKQKNMARKIKDFARD